MADDDAPFSLQKNDRGEVVLIPDGERLDLLNLQAACEEMARFLAAVDFGERRISSGISAVAIPSMLDCVSGLTIRNGLDHSASACSVELG